MNDIKPPSPLPKLNVRRVTPLETPAVGSGPNQAPVSQDRQLNQEKPSLPLLPKKRSRLRWILIGTTTFIALIVLVVVGTYTWYKGALKPLSNSSERIKIEVTQGESASQVASSLEQKKLIKSALALQIYIKLHGKDNVKVGNYIFAPNQGPEEMVQWLTDGRVDTFKMTILPGQTLAQLKKTFQSYGYPAADIELALSKQYSYPLLADKPTSASLEGYIFPETYFVSPDTKLEDLIKQSFDVFEKRIEAKDLKSQLQQRGFSLFQGITLASIIEKEVSNLSDQRQVAQVFETRLQKSMVLGSDVTYHYAAALLGVVPSPDLDSPYNTRKNPGLPPGPIANFNLAALEAVANPAQGDYLYFVAGDDGTTHYAHSEEEHQSNVQKYCQKLCAGN